ncbi:MAG: hypothetical protein IPN68_09925 [Bacteroidetes bacterium]|nr:hypothetical protein [Bacteroidota bacterium]
MALSDEINKVKYVAEDFSTYRTQADEFFQNNYPEDFNNLINTDLGNALMDQLAFAMGSLSFTINRRASELFLTTARLNKSIVKLARMLGYPIKSAAPASVDAVLKFTTPTVSAITINTGFQFQGPGEIVYEYRSEDSFVIPVGTSEITIPLKEGRSGIVVFTSDGSENQQFSILGIPDGQFLYADSFKVTVDAIEWERLDLIRYESANTYEVLFVDAPPRLRFGDGIAGKIPPTNSQIIVSYAYGFGGDGAIGSNQIAGPIQPLAINGVAVEFTVENPVAVVGEDPEDIRHVRAFASSFFRTQNAAVIKPDYDTIAQLRPGVAVADAQIMRGVSGDLTIQSYFDQLKLSADLIDDAAAQIFISGVSGIPSLGVSGADALFIDGISDLSVGNTGLLGVSGTEFLGVGVSGNVTGIEFLGVAGIPSLEVVGESGLIIGGQASLGVSGISSLGISGIDTLESQADLAVQSAYDGVSGLNLYLSQVFSDTSKANNVQIVVLSVDGNNKYIPPSSLVLSDVETYVQNIADAVVTVQAVDGSSNIVTADIEVELGITPTAVESDVIQNAQLAITRTVDPFGLLVRRPVGQHLYLSDIKDALREVLPLSEVRFINVKILNNLDLLDSDGNLIIAKQQVIQNGLTDVKVIKRFKRGENS